MELLIEIMWFIFLLGNAAVFGGFFHQRNEKSKDITSGMYLGGLVQLGGILGALLLTWIEFDVTPSTERYILLAVSLVIAALGFFFRNENKSNPPVWIAAGVLSAVALGLAFIWA